MNRFRQIVLWFSLAAVGVLLVGCVVGAFLGASRAKAMFNSPAFAAYWGALAVLLAAGLFSSRSMRSPGLLAVHLGALLVLAGGLWGSQDAHALRQRISGRQKPQKAKMLMFPSLAPEQSYRELWDITEDKIRPVGELPFDLRLNDVWVGFSPYPSLEIRDFKVDMSVILSDGREVARKTVEVNHPLHYGGYHFYLDQLDIEGQAVILKAVSDEGLYWVWAGFGLVCLGIVLRLWVRPILHAVRRGKEAEHGD